MAEKINNPSHYAGGTEYEHFKVALALGWHKNAFIYNCTKYLWRVGKKSPLILEDLKKARWYLDMEIQLLESGEKNVEEEGASLFNLAPSQKGS